MTVRGEYKTYTTRGFKNCILQRTIEWFNEGMRQQEISPKWVTVSCRPYEKNQKISR